MRKKLKIKVLKAAREALDQIPQHERAIIMKDFIAMCQNGSLLGKSAPVDMRKLKREDPKLYERIRQSLAEIENGKRQ